MTKYRNEEVKLKVGETFSTVFMEVAGTTWMMTENKSRVSRTMTVNPVYDEKAQEYTGDYRAQFSLQAKQPGEFEIEMTHSNQHDRPIEVVRYMFKVAPQV